VQLARVDLFDDQRCLAFRRERSKVFEQCHLTPVYMCFQTRRDRIEEICAAVTPY
jgi:hypothetical protein